MGKTVRDHPKGKQLFRKPTHKSALAAEEAADQALASYPQAMHKNRIRARESRSVSDFSDLSQSESRGQAWNDNGIERQDKRRVTKRESRDGLATASQSQEDAGDKDAGLCDWVNDDDG